MFIKIDNFLNKWCKQMDLESQTKDEIIVTESQTDKLRKMYTLWPPYSHWFLYIVHVIGVVGLLKYT